MISGKRFSVKDHQALAPRLEGAARYGANPEWDDLYDTLI